MSKLTPHRDKKLIQWRDDFPDRLSWWLEQYFAFEVTTSESSRKVQARDIGLFLSFMNQEVQNDERQLWTPRLTRSFQDYMQSALKEGSGQRCWSDRTINRVLANLKTFARWIHKLRPFPLGEPTAKIKLAPIGLGLEIERAITAAERRRLLDAADLLPTLGGRSRDRNRYKNQERPIRKNYRPWRNRAMIYLLIETGMRRIGLINLDLDGLQADQRRLRTMEKGGLLATYMISTEGLKAVIDYLEKERPLDAGAFQANALFLPPASVKNSKGRIQPSVVNTVWNQVCKMAGVGGAAPKTPHSARHAMGRHLIEKTGNIEAVQRQLNHKNVAYSLQYARITAEELSDALDER